MGQSYDTKTYDADQVRCAAFGVPISKAPGGSGYAEGVFIEIEQDGPNFTYKKGADGSVTRSKTNEPITKVTIHLMQSSESNAVLSAMLNKDIKGKNGAGVGTLVIEDTQGTSLFESGACWVSGPPKVGYGKEADERAWEIHCTKVERLDGGN